MVFLAEQCRTASLGWGAFLGRSPSAGAEFEELIGSPMDMRATFVFWGNWGADNRFPFELALPLRDSDKILVIYWEAMDYNLPTTYQPDYNYDAILRGNWDDYIRSFADSARSYGGKVILVPFIEMNSNWSPWAGTINGNTPEKHIAAYRHVREVFGEAPNVRFGWAVNSNSVPDTPLNAIERYYPGDEYVDYVGVDGFNFDAPWLSFSEIFDESLKKLERYDKPIIIFSFASAEGEGKAEWIRNALMAEIPKHSKIIGWIWFNEDKEKNWLVSSDPSSLEAFRVSIPKGSCF